MPVIGDTTDNGHPFEYMQVYVKQLCQSDEQLCLSAALVLLGRQL